MIKKLYKQHREVIQYLIFGVLTTLVNFVTYYILKFVFGNDDIRIDKLFNAIACIISIIFAYVTNRTWVFQSKAKGFKNIVKEMISFFSCRAFTMVLDTLIFWVGHEILNWNDFIVKCISQVVVIVLNYVLSKLIVFRKKEKSTM